MSRRLSKRTPGYPVETVISGISQIDYLTSGSVTPITGSIWDVSGTVTALQGTSPWVISGTVNTGAGTQDVDIVGQSLSKLNVGITDTTSTVNAVLQTDNVGLMKSTGGTISQVTTVPTVSALTAGSILVIGGLRVAHCSTTSTLAASGTYTSTSEDVLNFHRMTVLSYADVAGTLTVQQSGDNSNWDYTSSTQVAANEGAAYSVEFISRYSRIQYINSSTAAQSIFRLYAYKSIFR